MLKSEVQHQFWITKKVVERKLGTKEDDCIVSSDAELDAKIELFKSISESCNHLYRIIDQFQERLCILAQEENALGKFLKETGKGSNTSGKIMIYTGKAISYCGQQRMTMRPPLLRLFHEVETFRERAIRDTQYTIMLMERERTEYRATLSWMKSASNELDPDTVRSLEKFRKAQAHVRSSKEKFDKLTLDCLQKIDLLAAARCNMFSHALVGYMNALLLFAKKSSETFKVTAQALSTGTQYNFSVLKELADTSVQQENENSSPQSIIPIDSDQMLFFLDDYTDDKKEETEIKQKNQLDNKTKNENDKWENLAEISSTNESKKIMNDTADMLNNIINPTNFKSNNENLLNLCDDFSELTFEGSTKTPSFMPSQLLLNDSTTSSNLLMDFNMSDTQNLTKDQSAKLEPSTSKTKNQFFDFFNRPSTNKNNLNNSKDEKSSKKINKSCSQSIKQNTFKINSKNDMSSWFELFAELDPLSNPDAISKIIDGGKDNNQTT